MKNKCDHLQGNLHQRTISIHLQASMKVIYQHPGCIVLWPLQGSLNIIIIKRTWHYQCINKNVWTAPEQATKSNQKPESEKGLKEILKPQILWTCQLTVVRSLLTDSSAQKPITNKPCVSRHKPNDHLYCYSIHTISANCQLGLNTCTHNLHQSILQDPAVTNSFHVCNANDVLI